MSYKWGLLLVDPRLSRRRCVQRLMVYCSAMMWGLALPSTVGADGIRVMLVRRFGVRVDDTLATILVERGIGFVSALLTAWPCMILLLRRLLCPTQPSYDSALLSASCALLVAIGVLLLLLQQQRAHVGAALAAANASRKARPRSC